MSTPKRRGTNTGHAVRDRHQCAAVRPTRDQLRPLDAGHDRSRRGCPPNAPRLSLEPYTLEERCMTKRDDLMTTKEAAAYVRLSPRTLERYRVTGEGPVSAAAGAGRRRRSTERPSRVNRPTVARCSLRPDVAQSPHDSLAQRHQEMSDDETNRTHDHRRGRGPFAPEPAHTQAVPGCQPAPNSDPGPTASPKYLKRRRTVLYRRVLSLREWLEIQHRRSTSDPGPK